MVDSFLLPNFPYLNFYAGGFKLLEISFNRSVIANTPVAIKDVFTADQFIEPSMMEVAIPVTTGITKPTTVLIHAFQMLLNFIYLYFPI